MGAAWAAPGERGLDDVRVDAERDAPLLAFLHLSEGVAAREFSSYLNVLRRDPATRDVFARVLRDEEFHMGYTHAQLRRVAPQSYRRLLWRARLGRLWKGYLRLAGGLAALFGTVVLSLQFYLLLPPFALLAKRAARRAPEGWTAVAPDRNGRIVGQY